MENDRIVPPDPSAAHFLGIGPMLALRGTGAAVSRNALIYKIATAEDWARAERLGRYVGAPVDRADGFIHFSTAAQLPGTAAKHFAGQSGLLLVAVRPEALGAALRHEPARGGDLFPHLYAPLPLSAVAWVRPIESRADGTHILPLGEGP